MSRLGSNVLCLLGFSHGQVEDIASKQASR
jgi:hypothetical protein